MKKLLLLLLLISFSFPVIADNSGNDIFISVVQPERSEVPQEAAHLIESKLRQLITSCGVADSDPQGRFVITAKSDVLTKDIIGGAPSRVSQKIDFTFIIGDAIENKIFESYTISAIGIGINENKSYINAISKLKTNTPEMKIFIDKAKEKIVQYFQQRCQQIIVQAKQNAAAREYQEAIYLLMQVPEVCDCAEECQYLMIDYYNSYTEGTAVSLLNSAKSAWASAPNASGAAKAADIIGNIPANSKVQDEIDLLVAEINKKLREDEKRDWDFKMQKYNDEVARQKREYQLRKERQDADISYRNKKMVLDHEETMHLVSACRAVGLAYANNYQPPTYYVRNINAW